MDKFFLNILILLFFSAPAAVFAVEGTAPDARDTALSAPADGSAPAPANSPQIESAAGAVTPRVTPSPPPTSTPTPTEIKVIELTEPVPPKGKDIASNETPPKKMNTGALAFIVSALLCGAAWAISKFFFKGKTEKKDEKENTRCEDIKTLLDQKIKEMEDSAMSWPENKLKELVLAKTLTDEQKALLAKYTSAKEKYENLKKAVDLLKGKYDLCMLKLPSAAGQKRVFIIHGWGGGPDEHWIPWLKKELEAKNFKVSAPQMPDTDNPKIESWVNYLKEIVQEPDENTYFIGHSVGCQAVMRYLETLYNKRVGGVVFIAGWFNLDNLDEGEYEISEPWIETPISFQKIKNTLKNPPVVFLSDDEPYGFVEENKKIFMEKLSAEVIIEKNKGHFTRDEGVDELPEAYEAIIKMTK